MKIERCFRDKDHLLILREKKTSDQVIIVCRICTRVISEASFYACYWCEYYLHSSCADLPHQITRSFHHDDHPLTLTKEPASGSCYNCGKKFNDALYYECVHGYCSFKMDVECALMPAVSSPCGEGPVRCIQHFSHQHSLFLVDKDGIECKACGSACSGLAYGCTKYCNFFLHISCAEFPREIRHPHAYPYHGFLSLRLGGDCFRCHLCNRFNYARQSDFFFTCNLVGCRCRLCWSCSRNARRRAIKYEGGHYHHHKLQFVERFDTEIAECDAYDGYCTQPVTANSSELSHYKSSILRCVSCRQEVGIDFKLHILCGPLPSTIKHECHIHSLTLVDSLVEDDYDEYYCDVCETERDPRIRCYHCKECKYFAHVHCLYTEIAKALSAEEDQLRDHDIELKIMGQDLWILPDPESRDSENKLDLTLNDLIRSLTPQEQYHLEKFYRWDDTSSTNKGNTITNLTPQSEPIMSTEDVDETLKLIRFEYSDFETFFGHQLEKFYLNQKFPFRSRDLKLKIVSVEGYKVPHTVSRVMRVLLHRYGDISSDSQNCSTEWKSIVYFLVCEALRRMSTTMIIDITKSDLREWYFHLKFAKNMGGFKVDFACALLERQVRAFLGHQADKLKDQVPATVRRNIAILAGKMAKLQQEIDEENSKLEICNAYSGPAAKSQFMSDCLKEAFDMKLKKACSDRDLFPDQQRRPTYKIWNE